MDMAMIKVTVRRYDPSSDKSPYWQTYDVMTEPGDTVLSVLRRLYEMQDHSLAFYYSCRIGKCAGCQVKVNGKLRLACTEPVRGDLTLEPQDGYPVLRDLYVDKHTREKKVSGGRTQQESDGDGQADG